MPSLELAYPDLRKINPALVMVSISNFGQTGPYRDYRATDVVEYALGGLMYVFGSYDREPLKHALHQAQFKAGADSASAALMALYHQRLTAEGQQVDISIQEMHRLGAARRGQHLYLHRGSAAASTQPLGRLDPDTGDFRRVYLA